MFTDEQTLQDVVCGMRVPRNQYAIDSLGMHFAFCSLQCKERFVANPHLYIGHPGQQSPKQNGGKVMKRRRFRLGRPLKIEEAEQVRDHVVSMMGIYAVTISGDTIDITYDLLEATAEQIESALGAAGAALGSDLGQRLRRAFVHFVEETEIDSLEIPPSPPRHHH